jgi:hypothetical protein
LRQGERKTSDEKRSPEKREKSNLMKKGSHRQGRNKYLAKRGVLRKEIKKNSDYKEVLMQKNGPQAEGSSHERGNSQERE